MPPLLEPVEACDLCGATARRRVRTWSDPLWTTTERFTLVACEQCGFHFLDPRPPASEIHQYYPDDYTNYQAEPPPQLCSWLRRAGAADELARQGIWRLLLRIRQATSRRFIPPFHGEGRLLDVGCGAGGFLDTMRLLGWRTFGVEPSPRATERARAKGHAVELGCAEALPFPGQQFDTITMSHVLEHTHSPRAALDQVRSRLVPGGRLILAVPNYGSLHRRLFGNAWCGAEPPRHLFQFDRNTLKRALEQAGFRDVCISSRTGAGSYVRGLRQTANRLLGTRWLHEPRWLSVLFEAPSGLFSLFGYLGMGSDLRATAEAPR